MSDVIPPRPDLDTFERPSARSRYLQRAGGRGSTWSPWTAVGFYLLALVVGSFATLPVFATIDDQHVANLVASAIVAIVNVAVLVVWLQRWHPGWVRAIGLPSRPIVESGWGALFGIVLYVAVIVIGGVLASVFRDVVGRPVTTPRQVPQHLEAFGLVVTVVYAIVIAPIHEELFFRGILFRSVRDRAGFAAGAVVSAVAFGLVHYLPARSAADSLLLMTVMVFTGLGLATLYERRGNIVASMVAHATFNVIGILAILFLR